MYFCSVILLGDLLILREEDDVFNGEFSLENMTPVSRADWVANQISLSKNDISYESVKHALSLGVVWPKEHHVFYDAAKNGHTQLFKPLQNSGLDVNSCSQDKTSPICAAIRHLETESALELLSIGAKVIQKELITGDGLSGVNALIEACYICDANLVKQFVQEVVKQEKQEALAYINQALSTSLFNWDSQRPLKEGELKKVVETLIDNGADPEEPVIHRTILDEEVQYTLLDIVKKEKNPSLTQLVEERIKQKHDIQKSIQEGLPLDREITIQPFKIKKRPIKFKPT